MLPDHFGGCDRRAQCLLAALGFLSLKGIYLRSGARVHASPMLQGMPGTPGGGAPVRLAIRLAHLLPQDLGGLRPEKVQLPFLFPGERRSTVLPGGVVLLGFLPPLSGLLET